MYVVRAACVCARCRACECVCMRARRVCVCVTRALLRVHYIRVCVCVCVSRQYTVSVILRFWRLRRHQHGGFPRARPPTKRRQRFPGGVPDTIFFGQREKPRDVYLPTYLATSTTLPVLLWRVFSGKLQGTRVLTGA